MDIAVLLNAFQPLDALAVGFLFVSWALIGWIVERDGARHKSASVLMKSYRREWMTHVATRDPRVYDAFLLGNLRDGTAFLASACLIAIGGGMALLSNTETVSAIAEDFLLDAAPQIALEVKIFVVLLLVTNAFLKFVWSNRVFGYCAVLLERSRTTPQTRNARSARAKRLNLISPPRARLIRPYARSISPLARWPG